MADVMDLFPKFKPGIFFLENEEKKRVKAVRVNDITGAPLGSYEYTRHWGGIIQGIRYHCFCGCREVQELRFGPTKAPVRGEWNGSIDNPVVKGNRVSIIDGYWAMKHE